jgi:hypothetical protein
MTPELEPIATAQCIICKQYGQQVSDGWYKETFIDNDGNDEYGEYLAGQGWLSEATDTPSGWVCSERCQSQAMYNRATPDEKEALKKVHAACRAIVEYGTKAREVINKAMDSYVGESLLDEPAFLLEAVKDDGNSMPEWCNYKDGK